VAEPGMTIERMQVEQVLERYRALVTDGLRAALEDVRQAVLPAPAASPLLDEFYAQIEYHLGWRHPDLSRARRNSGKLLRPTLLLLGVELSAGRAGGDEQARADLARRALPAAESLELVHNFSLVHDDIEDADEERRHRPTLWKLWGVPQAINTGDGIFAIARAALWRLVDQGFPAELVLRLAVVLDRACVEICEGQFLDMTYEGRQDVTVELYLEMIGRKTAALMAAALRMGALLGAPEDAAAESLLAAFGRALGTAFQLRDDLLGIWAPEAELGKMAAGDLRRKKMSLPVIHALQTANRGDREVLRGMYQAPGAATEDQIAMALAILERAGARERVAAELREQGQRASAALAEVAAGAPEAQEARALLEALLEYVLAAVA
jgi:geranylgeranyl diphosphate synthase type I